MDKKLKNIGLFSPSTPLLHRRIKYVNLGVSILKTWGFNVVNYGDKNLKQWEKLRDPEIRAAEFNDLIVSNEVDILLAIWGGKNSNDILDLINYDSITNNFKPILGTSDISVLLNAITWKTKVVTYHGPNVLGKLNQTKEHALPWLKSNPFDLPSIVKDNLIVINPGIANGILVGGSLGTFTVGLSGTDYCPMFNEMIFFFESASLDKYQIQQHLRKLEISNFLNKVSGVVLGQLTKLSQDEIDDLGSLLKGYLKNAPILYSPDFGHGDFYNFTFPIGKEVEINTRNDERIRII